MDSSVVQEATRHEATNSLKQPGMEPVPGYRLIEPLGSGGFGEVWKCEAPGGLFKAIKFVYGQATPPGPRRPLVTRELDALQLVKNIRHPFLLSLERVEVVDGDLLIVMELADLSLADRLAECQQQGTPGIPREELLEYLCEAAEVLDVMNLQHRLQHLDIKPHNLFLVGNHIKVADFGVVQSLARLTQQDDMTVSAQVPAGITPLYSAPETFQGRPSPCGDQYSLAITYCELLTGKPPFSGRNSRQLLYQHFHEPPDLTGLPEKDRPLVGRALAKQPEARFSSCLAFVQALVTGVMPPEGVTVEPPRRLPPTRMLRKLCNMAADTKVHSVTPSTPLSGEAPPAVERVQAPPGYRLGNCVQRDPLREVWQVSGRSGQARMLFAYFNGQAQAQAVETAARLQALRNVGLQATEAAHAANGSLFVVTEGGRKNLAARFQECRLRGLSGVPRQELLNYLRTVADTLDQLAEQHGFAHLLLSPRHLLLANGRALLAEAGVGAWFWQPGGQALAALNPEYGAPELATPNAGRRADQYSLALIYLEMLTGAAYTPERPHALRLAPLRDRDALARALQRQPEQRWPSCRALIDALLPPAAAGEGLRASVLRPAAPPTPPAPNTGGRWSACAAAWNYKVVEVIRATAGNWQLHHHKQIRYLLRPGEVLLHRCASRLPAAVAAYKMEGFVQQHRGLMLETSPREVSFQVPLTDKLASRTALGVKVEFQNNPARTASALTVIGIEIRALGCEANEVTWLLREVAPVLLENLREELQARCERRADERLAWETDVTVREVLPDGAPAEPLTCRTKDISLRGIGLIAPRALPLGQLAIDLPATGQSEAAQVMAKVVRVEPRPDGTFEIGAQFVPRS